MLHRNDTILGISCENLAAAFSNGVDKVVDDEKTVENNEIYDFGNANKSSDEGSKLEGPNFQEIAHVEVNMEEGYNGDLGGSTEGFFSSLSHPFPSPFIPSQLADTAGTPHLSRFWSSGNGSHETAVVEFEIAFHGIDVSRSEVILDGSEAPVRVEARALLSYEKLTPIAKLNKKFVALMI
ncbi:hypothetical protein L2E82_26976 [Cichorium intybus]|uniref:Uncharacterized protein n=1 Tax=Cichorium intybus TaxID=13427 RepID=A0ACB9CRQ3_CICIN|nr:hypothetical protein L2E82_26976 [Cichorium intybus]